MRRFNILCAASALCVAFSASANAGVISSLLTFDGPVHHTLNAFGSPTTGGGEDQLNDESRGKLVDPGSDGFSTGDILFGMITISDVDSSGVPNVGVGAFQQIAMVYAAKILAPVSGDPAGFFRLGAVGDSTNAHDLRKLLDSTLGTSAALGLDDSSVFVMLGNQTGTHPSEGGSAADPLNFDLGTPELELLEFNSGNGWAWEATGGIVTSTDYFQAQLALSGDLTEKGGFSIQKHDFGSGTVFLPVDVKSLLGAITTHDVILFNGTVTATSDAPWDFEDQSAFVVNAVPEPATLGIWTGILVAFGAARVKRRIRAFAT